MVLDDNDDLMVARVIDGCLVHKQGKSIPFD